MKTLTKMLAGAAGIAAFAAAAPASFLAAEVAPLTSAGRT